MKVESIIKRDPPTKITLGRATYSFAEDDQGRHVCEVKNSEHLARLLSITEGYRVVIDGEEGDPFVVQGYAGGALTTLASPVVVADGAEPLGAMGYPEVIDLGDGTTVPRADAILAAYRASGLSLSQWNNQLEDEDRAEAIDGYLDSLVAPPPVLEGELIEAGEGDAPAEPVGEATAEPSTPAEEGDEDPEREALAQQYEAKFGKRPHGKWSVEKIRAALEAPEAE